MKKYFHIISIAMIAAVFSACVAAESEVLKEARTIQQGTFTQKQKLDSTLTARIEDYTKNVTQLSSDSVLMKDSTIIEKYNYYRSGIESLSALKSKLDDWSNNTKKLPSVEEIRKGVENPFGKDAKDEDIMKAVKKSQEELQVLQSEIETALQ
jgi:uncharacterized protein YlxW (UPF0749 family)